MGGSASRGVSWQGGQPAGGQLPGGGSAGGGSASGGRVSQQGGSGDLSQHATLMLPPWCPSCK